MPLSTSLSEENPSASRNARTSARLTKPRKRCETSRPIEVNVKTAHRARDRSSPARPARHTRTVSTVRSTEPWAALLETGRADERLVHEDRYQARRERTVPLPDELRSPVRHALEQAG